MSVPSFIADAGQRTYREARSDRGYGTRLPAPDPLLLIRIHEAQRDSLRREDARRNVT